MAARTLATPAGPALSNRKVLLSLSLLPRRLTPVAVAVAATVALPSAASAQAPAAPALPPGTVEVLPDLVMEVPSKLAVSKARRSGKVRWDLGFRSSAVNVGPGALNVRGTRASTAEPLLNAEQLVNVSDGTRMLEGQFSTRPNVGKMRFQAFGGHSHWHLLKFQRFQLIRGTKVVRKDRKYASGYCLGNRYLAIPNAVFAPEVPNASDQCGKDDRALLELNTAIQVGFGDPYDPFLEGQSIDITGLKAGTYTLAHIVNPARSLFEASLANNASSVSVRIRWPRGKNRKPTVRVLKRCAGSRLCR